MNNTVVRIPFELGDVNISNINQLKVININTLPVRYSDKFYKELIPNYTSEYLKFAFWNGFAVGAICARLEALDPMSKNHEVDTVHKDSNDPIITNTIASTETLGKKSLYIMTINVLAAYRRRGIASSLLNYVLEKASKDFTIAEVYLHVQISNEEAREFYIKHGFEQVCVIKDYYKKIDPPDCFLFRKILSR